MFIAECVCVSTLVTYWSHYFFNVTTFEVVKNLVHEAFGQLEVGVRINLGGFAAGMLQLNLPVLDG
jgi:hypothetical protein